LPPVTIAGKTPEQWARIGAYGEAIGMPNVSAPMLQAGQMNRSTSESPAGDGGVPFFVTRLARNAPRSLLFPYVTPRLAEHICNKEGQRRMRMTGIGLIAAAILAGSMGIAVAQTSTTTPSPSASAPGAMKCWDSVTKQVRNETPSTIGSTTASGTSTTSSTPSTGAGSTSSATRPPEAAGLPDCKH
jgi:hypothetical protein